MNAKIFKGDDGKFFALGESERLLYRNCEHECRDKESRIWAENGLGPCGGHIAEIY